MLSSALQGNGNPTATLCTRCLTRRRDQIWIIFFRLYFLLFEFQVDILLVGCLRKLTDNRTIYNIIESETLSSLTSATEHLFSGSFSCLFLRTPPISFCPLLQKLVFWCFLQHFLCRWWCCSDGGPSITYNIIYIYIMHVYIYICTHIYT